jgi:uncharacterized membrane protein YgdD (TMEM256/DUF423 family)
MADRWIVAAGLGGFAGVALGASGAHLTGGDAEAARLIETASRFLLIHALALGLVGALARTRPAATLSVAGALFSFGGTVFSAGLTLFATAGSALAQWSTPVGGTSLLAGWLALALYGLRRSG